MRRQPASFTKPECQGNKDAIEFILAHEKVMDTKHKRGETALQIAVRNKHPAIVELLRQHGAA